METKHLVLRGQSLPTFTEFSVFLEHNLEHFRSEHFTEFGVVHLFHFWRLPSFTEFVFRVVARY